MKIDKDTREASETCSRVTTSDMETIPDIRVAILEKTHFLAKNDPKFARVSSDPVGIKQWGCHHSKEHQKSSWFVFPMMDLVKI